MSFEISHNQTDQTLHLSSWPFLKKFSLEGPTTKRDFREKRKSGEVFCFGRSGGGGGLIF